jgi:hypothetical protein
MSLTQLEHFGMTLNPKVLWRFYVLLMDSDQGVHGPMVIDLEDEALDDDLEHIDPLSLDQSIY